MRKGKYFYEKAIGGKTGYLSAAGHTLVVAAKDHDRTLIAVLLKASDRGELFSDAIKMFEAAFNQTKVERVLLKKGPQTYTQEVVGAREPLETYLKEDVAVEYYPAEELKLKCFLIWTVKEAPIAKDQVVGELRIQTPQGKLIKSVPLYAFKDVSKSWWRSFLGFSS